MITNPILLTIAIPTFDRPSEIVKRISELLPQLTSSTELIILDNCSPLSVQDWVETQIPDSKDKIRHVRHSGNIGGNANVCRCFEHAQGQWIWILGDDDEVLPDTVATIFSTIAENRTDLKISGFYFSTGIYSYAEAEQFNNLSTFIEHLQKYLRFGNAMFISAGVYNVPIARAHLRDGYLALSSHAPHLAIAMSTVRGGYNWYVVPSKIVNWPPPGTGETYNSLTVALGLPLLTDVAGCTNAVIKNLSEAMFAHLPWPLITKGLLSMLLDNSRESGYWIILFNRLKPFGSFRKKLQVKFLLQIAYLLDRWPIFKKPLLGIALYLPGAKELRNFDFGHGHNRL